MINDSLRFVESILRYVAREREREAAMERKRSRQRGAKRQRESARQWQKAEREEREPEAERPREWWDVLGVSPQASAKEIRRSYTAKLKQYHPDRLNGLAPELVGLAELRTKELNAAFAQAKQRA